MAFHQTSEFQARRASLALLLQPIHKIDSAMAAQAQALEKLGSTVDMTVFQELLDLDTPNDVFSKEVVNEFFILAPETLASMEDSLYVPHCLILSKHH